MLDKENCDNESQNRSSQHHGLMYNSPRSGPSSQNLQHEINGSNGSNKTPRSPRRPKSKSLHLTPNHSTDGGYDSERDLFLSSDEREGNSIMLQRYYVDNFKVDLDLHFIYRLINLNSRYITTMKFLSTLRKYLIGWFCLKF